MGTAAGREVFPSLPLLQAVYGVLKEAEHRSTFYIPYWNIPIAKYVVPRQIQFHKGEREHMGLAGLHTRFGGRASCGAHVARGWGVAVGGGAMPGGNVPCALRCAAHLPLQPLLDIFLCSPHVQTWL